MRIRHALLLVAFLAPPPLAQAQAQSAGAAAPAPPATRGSDQVDDYHGRQVADPYRWLEDTDAPETAAWVSAQNAVTFAYLAAIPEREAIRKRLTQLWNYERYSTPFRRAGRYFYFRNDGLQSQSVLYSQPSLDAPPAVLLDPNTMSADGTVALSMTAVSHDARYLAYGTSSSGSDWQEFRVRAVADGTDLDDHLRWIKFSGASWTRDGKGFFYSRYPEPRDAALTESNRNQTLYYHRIGTPQAEDVLAFAQPDRPDRGVGAQVTDDGRYAILGIWQGSATKNGLYVMDLADSAKPRVDAPVVRLLDAFDAQYSFLGNDGPVLYVQTDLEAPRGRIVAIDLRRPDRSAWREIVPEGKDVLTSAGIIANTLVLEYLHDARSVLQLVGLDGTPVREIPLPAVGTVGSISGERTDREMFYSFTSYLFPTTIYRYDFASAASTVFRAPKIDFDTGPYVTEQVFFQSRDGTRVPMFITRRRDLERDGSAPTYLTAYGGFNISTPPAFSVSNLVWLEMGGILAMPNLRGGGEYGEDWHQAGMLGRKQNVFDDFIAAAEYLIAEGYTSPAKLAIAGGSNGGLLVGAAMTQRPELFGAALPAVGVMDMLRYHKFTIGWAWVPEYGSADSAAQFEYLIRYSPLHNLKPGTDYPATMVTTADHDDRVVPGHSFKFAAALQAASAGRRPALIRIESKAGHGAGKPTAKIIEEQADRWAFLSRNLGMRPVLP
jgi:prolyl oligopeptidase